jgi:hypothetical protein
LSAKTKKRKIGGVDEDSDGKVDDDDDNGDDNEGDERGPGRQPAAFYRFKPSFRLYKSHCIQLLSKQVVPLLFQPSAPQFTSKMSVASKSKLARFMLALFSPHDSQTNLPKHGYSWPSFNAFAKTLLQVPEGGILPSFVGYCTYKVMWNIVDSPKNVKKDELAILSAYRYSNRLLWSNQKSSTRSKANESDGRFYYEDGTIDPYKDLVKRDAQHPSSSLSSSSSSSADYELGEKEIAELSTLLRLESMIDKQTFADRPGNSAFHQHLYLDFLKSSIVDGNGLCPSDLVVVDVDKVVANSSGTTSSNSAVRTETQKSIADFWKKIKSYDVFSNAIEKPFESFDDITIEQQQKWRNDFLNSTDDMKPSEADVIVPGPISRKLKPEQKVHVARITKIIDNLKNDDMYPTHAEVLLGSGGSGKTFTVSSILEQCLVRKVGVLACAWTGCASSLLTCQDSSGKRYPAETFFTTVRYPSPKRGQKEIELLTQDIDLDQLTKMLKTEWSSSMSVIVVDEVSMLDERHIYRLQQVCLQVSNCDSKFKDTYSKNPDSYPFGRFLVIMMGDTRQLPPVNGSFFYESAIKKFALKLPSANYNIVTGIKGKMSSLVHEKFRWSFLEGQTRTSDEKQIKIINKIGKISPTSPFDDELMEELGDKVIKTADLSKWSDSSFIVLTNAERHLFCYYLGLSKAKRLNIPFITWNNKVTKPSNLYDNLTPEDISRFHIDRKELLGTFYFGCKGYLNAQESSRQLKTRLGIVNSAYVRQEALIFDENSKEGREIASKLRQATGFQIIHLGANIPLAIECTLLNQDSANWPVKDLSSHPTECRILVSAQNQRGSFKNYKNLPLVEYQCAGVDSAHAGTDYKFQGRTQESVVLVVNNQPTSSGINLKYICLYLKYTVNVTFFFA